MITTIHDINRDMALEELHHEAVMKRATHEQCIFLFVEGDSEARAIPLILDGDEAFDTMGVKVAPYNGRGNLAAALRLLYLTLSSDRPIILTYDNDPESTKSVEACRKKDFLGELVYEFPIPSQPIVTYPCGHGGGSFEESFPMDVFLSATFHESIVPPSVRSGRKQFKKSFDPSKPWMSQMRKFCAQRGFFHFSKKKTALAKLLAFEIDEAPPTYVALEKLVQDVRARYPVKHPDDVVLPKVRGLTC